MSGLQKYPECDLCTSTECNDDKVSQIFEDVEFTKQFLLNMKKGNVKYEEIANDCYLMAEVISGKTDPLDISEFAFCIYVSLAQLVELDPQQRMEVAVVFKELLDKISGNIGTGRKVTKKGSVNEEVETADDTRSFLSHLDDEIADLEATSAQFYTTPATAPPATR